MAALVACYGPHAQSGAPCDPLAPHCPTDQACAQINGAFACVPTNLAELHDAPAPLDATDGPVGQGDGPLTDAKLADATPVDAVVGPDANPDVDGDGVPNAQDNCPTVANPGQENEDGDRFGDACDSCPPFAHDAPSDPDGDGVSDECDPNPSTAGDAIALFEGFHHGIPTGWAKDGVWTAAGDAVSVSIGSRNYLTTSITTTTHETVSAGMTVDNLTGTGGDAAAGVVDNFDPTKPHAGVFCNLMRDTGTFFTATADLGTHAVQTPYELTLGTAYVLTQHRDGNGYTCTGARGLATATANTTAATASAIDGVGIRASHAAATFRWVMVVTSP